MNLPPVPVDDLYRAKRSPQSRDDRIHLLSPNPQIGEVFATERKAICGIYPSMNGGFWLNRSAERATCPQCVKKYKYWFRELSTSEEKIIELVRCGQCEAKRGHRCVYMPVSHNSADFGQVGRPMPSVHNARRNSASLVERKKRLSEEASYSRTRPKLDDVNHIARLEERWDREERLKLVWWLARYSNLLTGEER